MSIEQEKEFEKLVPLKSVLGREFLALQTEHKKQRQAFEASPDKLGIDTTPYRRSELALDRFLDEMLDLLNKHLPTIEAARLGLECAEFDAKHPIWGSPLTIDRRSEQIIWTRFAIERYRSLLPKAHRKKLRAYHPSLHADIALAWKEFRQQMKRWQFGRMPWDGSQAMHAMLDFQLKVRLLASAND